MLQIVYNPTNFKIVGKKADFPAAVAGVITLPADTNWIITQAVDLLGDRLVCAGIVAIHGVSSETAYLSSTGLVGSDALITTNYSLPLQNLTITSTSAPALDIGGGINTALDWTKVNFLNTPDTGTIKDIGNFVGVILSWLNSGGLIFDGTAATIALSNTLFATSSGTALTLAATLVVSRRFRVIDCAFSIGAAAVGIDFVAGASVPIDQFLVRGCNFSGASATYYTGITPQDDISDWAMNKGIPNSENSGEFSMEGNATATVIANTADFVKAAGTTIVGDIQRFTHSNNRLTYLGAIQRTFSISMSLSLTAGNNNICRAMVRHYNSSDVLIKSSFAPNITSNGAGRAENVAAFLTTNLSSGDYLEIWVRNTSAVNNITVTDMQMIASLA